MRRVIDVEHDRDERLIRLGREWYGEVRRKPPPEKPENRRQDIGNDGSWLDAIFDAACGDGDGGDGGSSSD